MRLTIFAVLLLMLMLTCVPSHFPQQDLADQPVYQGFFLSNQTMPPHHIKSIQLGKNQKTTIPSLNIHSSERLVLKFDEVSESTSSFGIRFKRFNRFWQPDGLVPTQISTGNLDDWILDYQRSENTQPNYFSFSYSFPNDRIRFLISGNWMLEVYDYQTGRTQFSLPFFVTEQLGNLETRIETLNEMGYETRYQHQLFTDYSFTKQVLNPEFSIQVFAIQDGQFARQKELTIKDVSNRHHDIISFHHDRSDLFEANKNYYLIDTQNLRSSHSIRSVETLPDFEKQAFLYDINLNTDFGTASPFLNQPSEKRQDNYIETVISIVPPSSSETDVNYFLSGTFAGWALRPELKFYLNRTEQRLQANVQLKQGRYSFSVESVQNNTVQFSQSENRFGNTQRNYTALVYYRDAANFYDRLLFIEEINTK